MFHAWECSKLCACSNTCSGTVLIGWSQWFLFLFFFDRRALRMLYEYEETKNKAALQIYKFWLVKYSV